MLYKAIKALVAAIAIVFTTILVIAAIAIYKAGKYMKEREGKE